MRNMGDMRDMKDMEGHGGTWRDMDMGDMEGCGGTWREMGDMRDMDIEDMGHVGHGGHGGHGGMISVLLPDSITTWEIQAIAIIPGHGVCMSAPLRLPVTQELHVGLRLPYSTRPREQLQPRALLHSSLPHSVNVTVGLSVAAGVCASLAGGPQHLEVPPGAVVAVPFTLVALGPGDIPITVTARGPWGLGDRITRVLHVEVEGELHLEETSYVLDTDGWSGRSLEIPGNIPADVVPDGDFSMSVRVSGQVSGATLEAALGAGAAGALLRVPRGCGEQTMMVLAPAAAALRYLDESEGWARLPPGRRERGLRALQQEEEDYEDYEEAELAEEVEPAEGVELEKEAGLDEGAEPSEGTAPLSLTPWVEARRRRRALESPELRSRQVAFHVCIWRQPGTLLSGMAVVDISLLSGFRPHREDLDKLQDVVDRYISHYELDRSRLVLYFDEVPGRDPGVWGETQVSKKDPIIGGSQVSGEEPRHPRGTLAQEGLRSPGGTPASKRDPGTGGTQESGREPSIREAQVSRHPFPGEPQRPRGPGVRGTQTSRKGPQCGRDPGGRGRTQASRGTPVSKGPRCLGKGPGVRGTQVSGPPGACPRARRTLAEELTAAERHDFACYSPRVDYALVVTVRGEKQFGAFAGAETEIEEILQSGPWEAAVGQRRWFFVRAGCGLRLRSQRRYLLMGRGGPTRDPQGR
ncbi:complement C4-like [Apteryx rowi]|uniref:complement C4-like n=1 Tax=Apteryx rowi TaxID=308060 RepID=UPI000E1D4240|nr:complement C4-like [Apteryx rowi]